MVAAGAGVAEGTATPRTWRAVGSVAAGTVAGTVVAARTGVAAGTVDAAETVVAGSVAGSVEATLLIETVVLTSKALVTAGTVVAAGTVKRTVEAAGPIEAAAGTVLVVAAATVAEDATVYTMVTETVSMEALVTGTVDGRPARSRFVHEARLHFRVALLVVGSEKKAAAAAGLVAVRVALHELSFVARCRLLSSGLHVQPLPLTFYLGSVCGEPLRRFHFFLNDCDGACCPGGSVQPR